MREVITLRTRFLVIIKFPRLCLLRVEQAKFSVLKEVIKTTGFSIIFIDGPSTWLSSEQAIQDQKFAVWPEIDPLFVIEVLALLHAFRDEVG